MRYPAAILDAASLPTWRRALDPREPVGVVVGRFDLLHPGNVWALQQARARFGTVVVALEPDAAQPTLDAAVHPLAARAELASWLRSVSALVPEPDEATLVQLRPFVLIHCPQQTQKGPVAEAALRLAESAVPLQPQPGCFGTDIRSAICAYQTPLALSGGWGPIPALEELDVFLKLRGTGHCLVTVNGCFDILHVGHARLLAEAATLGDRLLVLINDDASVRAYKGLGKPVFPAAFRLAALKALASVDFAFPFSGDNPLDLLARIRPDIHVKGGSFEEARVGQEKALVESWGGHLGFCPMVEGYSTTNVLEKTRSPGKT